MRVRVPLSVLPRFSRPMGNERGATIVLVAIAMTALLSICALAIDIGMLFNSRSEAQRAADSGALAGASSLITRPTDEDLARERAIEFAEMNDVHGEMPDVQEADVDVDLANGRVTVRVLRTTDRGSGIATWFARVFGVDEVDVSADATAEVAWTGRAVCVRPLAVEDRYEDADPFDGGYNPDADDIYDPHTTGYLSDDADIGMPIVIKGGPDGTGPSWSQPWDVPQPPGGFCSGGPGGQGGKCFQTALEQCNPAPVDLNTPYLVENGVMQGPTKKGVNNAISRDPKAWWDGETIQDSEWGENWENSPRYGIFPVFHPGRVFEPGKQEIEFTNFIGGWYMSVEGGGNDQQVIALIMPARGLLGGEAPPSPNVLGVRLVE